VSVRVSMEGISRCALVDVDALCESLRSDREQAPGTLSLSHNSVRTACLYVELAPKFT
jgi:hypothetical protein